jgi:hypothetical protein
MVTKTADRETVLCSRAMGRKSAYAAREKAAGRSAVLRARKSMRAAELEMWRRTTSMTLDLEPFMDDRERREGLRRLMKWIEETVCHRRDAETQRTAGQRTALRIENGNGSTDLSPYPLPQGEGEQQRTALQIENCKVQISNLNDNGDLTQVEGEQRTGAEDSFVDAPPEDVADDREARKAMGLGADWELDASRWVRVCAGGVSIEALCERLGMTRARLTRLCKEYCNLSAQEMIDGFRLRGFKKILTVRMREAARELWGAPGYFAAFKCEGFLDCEGRRRDAKAQESAFFEGRDVERSEERKRRIGELVARIGRGFDWESFASRMGYLSATKLKRACLTVFGRRIESIERIFAAEIVDFYLCAEDRAMRELCLREPANAAVYRAREVYHGSEDAPAEPFLDRWSGAEFFNRGWLERMGSEFG